MTAQVAGVPGAEIVGEVQPGDEKILSTDAIAFVANLHRQFNPTRLALLAAREARQVQILAGADLGFLDETKEVREGDWTVAPAGPALNDRRVEITGPCDRKMVINALNSGAKVFMADMEDASLPTWRNVVDGQQNLYDAGRRTITFDRTQMAATTNWTTTPATLLVRPRGWHLPERHVLVDGEPISGQPLRLRALLLPQRPRACSDRGSGPYFYLPKMESHREARLWNDVFNAAQDALGHAARHDPRHRPDRDASGRVRDGRDPLRAARPRRGAQRRSLGLHLQRDQDVPRARGQRSFPTAPRSP